MNPRQRRGAILLAVAVVGAVAVFFGTATYIADVRSQVDPLTEVLVSTRPVTALQPLSRDALEVREMPERWVPAGALRSPAEVEGLVAANEIPAGSLLQQGMLEEEPDLAESERELAIFVDAETGVAGKIGPGEVVDIYATFPADAEAGTTSRSEIVVSSARILEVGQVTTRQADSDDGGFAQDEVVPVTFALSVRESLVLAYVESFAETVRLGRVAPGDEQPLDAGERVYQLTGDEAGGTQ